MAMPAFNPVAHDVSFGAAGAEAEGAFSVVVVETVQKSVHVFQGMNAKGENVLLEVPVTQIVVGILKKPGGVHCYIDFLLG